MAFTDIENPSHIHKNTGYVINWMKRITWSKKSIDCFDKIIEFHQLCVTNVISSSSSQIICSPSMNIWNPNCLLHKNTKFHFVLIKVKFIKLTQSITNHQQAVNFFLSPYLIELTELRNVLLRFVVIYFFSTPKYNLIVFSWHAMIQNLWHSSLFDRIEILRSLTAVISLK